MITYVFNNLKIGQILSNKHVEKDYLGNPVTEGYDYEIVAVDKENATITLKNLTFNSEYIINRDKDAHACATLYIKE